MKAEKCVKCLHLNKCKDGWAAVGKSSICTYAWETKENLKDHLEKVNACEVFEPAPVSNWLAIIYGWFK